MITKSVFVCEHCGAAYNTAQECLQHEQKAHPEFKGPVIFYRARPFVDMLRFDRVVYPRVFLEDNGYINLCEKSYYGSTDKYLLSKELLGRTHMRDGCAVLFTTDTSEGSEVRYRRELLSFLIKEKKDKIALLEKDLEWMTAVDVADAPATTDTDLMLYTEFIH